MDKNRKPLARATVLFAACALRASLASTAAFAQFEEGRLEHIQALKAPRLDGIVPTYYTPGYEQRARDPQRFITDEFDGVSLKLIDERTIEESDLKDGKLVKISRRALTADGQTIHARRRHAATSRRMTVIR